jgi:hypothetical protein
MTRAVHHVKSNAIAYLALFVALGGTSYAAIRLPAGSVGNRALKNHSVSAVKLDRSSIAGYVRDWARIDSNGRIVDSRPTARVVAWRTSGFSPGGLIRWRKPIPANCFALATTGVIPSASSVSAEVASAGQKQPGGAYVSLSTPGATVSVVVVCPQP